MEAAENGIKVKCMEPMKRKICQDFTRGENWVWSSRDELRTIPKSAILTIYPVLDVMLDLSNRINIVLKLMNNNIVKILFSSSKSMARYGSE